MEPMTPEEARNALISELIQFGRRRNPSAREAVLREEAEILVRGMSDSEAIRKAESKEEIA